MADPDERGASPYLSLERPDDDGLAVLESASVRYRIAVGPIAGRKTLRLQAPGGVGIATQVTKRLTTTRDGFSLFYLRGAAPKEVTTWHIYAGVAPFIVLQFVGVAVIWFFPAIATWLQGQLF